MPRPTAARAAALVLGGLVVAAVFAAARAAESSAPTAASIEPAAAAQRARQRRRQPRRTQPRRPAVDYSRFDHSTPEHRSPRRECSSCHVIQSLSKPDVTDFPDHPSCVECHRQQFFRGAQPAICSNCHNVTGPRSEARFRFPKPNEPREFAEVFPHSAHVKPTTLIQFRRFLGEKATTTDSCRHCHKPDTRELKPPAAASPAAGAKPSPEQAAATPAGFALPAGTFMTTPTSHATCFMCHWQKGVEGREQEPLANQCASCHDNIRLRARPAAASPAAATASASSSPSPAAPAATAATPAAGPARPAVPAALIVPASLARFRPARDDSWPARVSPKFVHELDAHKKRSNDDGKEVPINCTACHTSIRRATTLEALKLPENQVQLPTCGTSACHTATTGVAQMRLSVFRELRERIKDPKFDCALCHAPPISTAEVPCDHFAAVYNDAVKEKKSTTGIERAVRDSKRCEEVIPKKEGQ